MTSAARLVSSDAVEAAVAGAYCCRNAVSDVVSKMGGSFVFAGGFVAADAPVVWPVSLEE